MYIRRSFICTSAVVLAFAVITSIWSLGNNRTYAGDSADSQEGWECGVWVVTFPSPSGNSVWFHKIDRADSKGEQFTSIAYKARVDPSGFDGPAEYDAETPSLGEIRKIGARTYEGTWISYEINEEAGRPTQIDKILISYAKWQLVDKNTAKGSLTLAVYSGSQDANGDGLPDKGQRPIAKFENKEYTGRRLGIMRDL